ncbi:trichohyalin isoform X2 [Austrofundulus limnaeus]|uniref:Trichohyalin isoform X2 n=1 Tax=Austrofundulus limnaeus TaxID=52670 RepID=A0A2I4CS47_AUSLI|nr:PREDICTED: trichohyalin-like isoform X2 [Austrofundulus limnaeus]
MSGAPLGLKTSKSKEILHPDMSEAGVGDAAGLTMKVKPPLNLVLVGSRGTGKTIAAEAILDQTDLPPASSPSQCVKHEAEVCGRQVSVLQMPPLYDKPPEEVMEESFRCVSLCDPEGVHAFILVLPVGPLTDEDKGELQTIQDTFSPRVKDFIMILFTVDSDPAAPAVLNFIKETKEIQELCQSCEGRYFVLNVKEKKQIPQLLETVDQTGSEASRGFTMETFTRANMERVLKLQADLQDVRHKVDTDSELRGRLEEKEEEMRNKEEEMKNKEEEMKNKEEEMKKKHKEELKALRAQAEQERKQRVQQLKEKDESLEKEREKRKKEAEEEEKRRRKQEEAQRQEWKQKLEAAERRIQSERTEREKAESKLEQSRREMKRNQDGWEKEKDQIWERVLQVLKQNMEDLKENLQEERSSHRELQEEYHRRRRKWVYPWIFLFPLLFVVYLLYQFLTT